MNTLARTAWLWDSARETIEEEGSAKFPRETGGVLMGYWDALGRDVVIASAVGPGPEAYHDRTAFEPDHDYQLKEIARRYDASGRRFTYLGDWHTHPRGGSTLSRQDRRTLSRIARTPEARAPRPLMLLAVGAVPWRLVIWRNISTHRWWWRMTAEVLPIRVVADPPLLWP